MLVMNEIVQGSNYLVALCDKELIGKTLKSDDVEIHINPKFYGNKEVTPEEAIKALKKATIGNIFGKQSIELAKKLGLVDKEILIQGIPHAQFIKI